MTKARILIVEDQSIIALSLTKKLEELDYKVLLVVPSGEEAVESAAILEPDLILMDIMLSHKMDGIEAAEHIRTHFDIPVVYLTSHSDDATVERAKNTEPFGYLLKPFQERELDITLQMALYRAQTERKLKQQTRELEEALATIKALSGLIPICASCKSIRDDQGYWQQLEAYLEAHSEAMFSHGICPDCAARLYPNIFSDGE